MAAVTLSVVLPALNEADGIEAALDDAVASLGRLTGDGTISTFELIVVDDGSEDDTARLVEGRARADDRIRLVRHGRNRGVGAGLRTGIEHASGEFLLYTDADMPVHLEEVRRALPLLVGEVGVVAGQRSDYGAEPAVRTLASKVYDRFARLALRVATRDVNFPFKLLRVSVARQLGLRSEGALIDAELLARAQVHGLRIETLVMEYRSRQFGSSKTMSTRLLAQLAKEVVHHRAAILRPACEP